MLPDNSPASGGSQGDGAARQRPGRHKASRRERRQLQRSTGYAGDSSQAAPAHRGAAPMAVAAAGVMSVGAVAAGAGYFLFVPPGTPTASDQPASPAGAGELRNGISSWKADGTRLTSSKQYAPSSATPGDTSSSASPSAPQPDAQEKRTGKPSPRPSPVRQFTVERDDSSGRTVARPSPTVTASPSPSESTAPSPDPSPTQTAPTQTATAPQPSPSESEPTSTPTPTPSPSESSTPGLNLELPGLEINLPLRLLG